MCKTVSIINKVKKQIKIIIQDFNIFDSVMVSIAKNHYIKENTIDHLKKSMVPEKKRV